MSEKGPQHLHEGLSAAGDRKGRAGSNQGRQEGTLWEHVWERTWGRGSSAGYVSAYNLQPWTLFKSDSCLINKSCAEKQLQQGPDWSRLNSSHSPSMLSAQIWKPSSLEISKTSPFLGFFSVMFSFLFCSCWSQSISGELKPLSSSSTAFSSKKGKQGP